MERPKLIITIEAPEPAPEPGPLVCALCEQEKPHYHFLFARDGEPICHECLPHLQFWDYHWRDATALRRAKAVIRTLERESVAASR